jgi:hypothetical protein
LHTAEATLTFIEVVHVALDLSEAVILIRIAVVNTLLLDAIVACGTVLSPIDDSVFPNALISRRRRTNLYPILSWHRKTSPVA